MVSRTQHVARSTAPADVDALLRRGVEARERGAVDAALDHFRAALAADPDDGRAAQLLGTTLVEHDRADEAIEILRAAADRAGAPDAGNYGCHSNLANALRRAGHLDEAEPILRDLARVAPDQWQVWHNLGQVLKDTSRDDEAVAALRRAVALAPEYGPNHAVLGELLHRLGRLRAAESAMQRCIDLGWATDINLWTTLGNNRRLLGDVPGAIEALEHALALGPGQASAHNNLGIALAQAGRFDEALAHLDRACEIDPDSVLFRSNRGFFRLVHGDLDAGWHDWEHAMQGGMRGQERKLDVPRWTPDDRGLRVLVYREQGVGDEILFASCYPDIIAATRDVVIECDTRLVGLFARSFAGAEVRSQTCRPGGEETASDFDRAIPAGSLPKHFRRRITDFPERRSFLVPDPERVARWQDWLADLAAVTGGPVVGISWRSRISTKERRLEYTRLDEWAGIFAVPDVTWVSLQYDDCERELRDAERRFGVTIHRWDDVDYMNDFEEVAALTHCLDLVVAPRNAVAMLAGALGTPTVMMGNRWDWADLGTDTSPWFPSIELVHRHIGEDWDVVLATAARRVAETAARTKGQP